MSNELHQPQNTKSPHSDPTPVAASSTNTQVYPSTAPNVQPAHKSVTPTPKSNLKSNLKGFFGTIQLVVGAVLLAFVINAFIFQSYQVVGESMSPTLENGDRLIINKLGKTWSTIFNREHIPKRGDIIVFDSPISKEKRLIKRVIGLPGDTVEVKNGNITVYNDEHPEGFDPDADYKDTLPIDTTYNSTTEVGEGKLFVSGDNRAGGSSLDSRNDLGLVDTSAVIGELVLRLLPVSESKFF